MLLGNLDIFEIMDIFRNGAQPKPETPDDAAPVVKKPAKKAATKKAANANRTRR